jgi:hypothetical protein
MDYKFFESLDQESAEVFLKRFLELEKHGVEDMQKDAQKEGINMNYSLESLPKVLKWVSSNLKITRIPVPETEPEWIRQFHKEGLIEFYEESKINILRVSYYFGETFIKVNKSLSWAVGNPENIEKNMPVITGFRYNKEMAPMMIMENTFLDMISLPKGTSLTKIGTMINKWLSFCP